MRGLVRLGCALLFKEDLCRTNFGMMRISLAPGEGSLSSAVYASGIMLCVGEKSVLIKRNSDT